MWKESLRSTSIDTFEFQPQLKIKKETCSREFDKGVVIKRSFVPSEFTGFCPFVVMTLKETAR